MTEREQLEEIYEVKANDAFYEWEKDLSSQCRNLLTDKDRLMFIRGYMYSSKQWIAMKEDSDD